MLRDKTIILVMYLHGLRIKELIGLQWSDIDFRHGRIHIRRIKGSEDSTQDLRPQDEVKWLRKLRTQTRDLNSRYVFVSERGDQLDQSTAQKMTRRIGQVSGLEDKVGIIHPHMLRHATGYALADQGVDTRHLQHYLGHQNIRHTVKYTSLAANALRGIIPK